jgi:hypothetical protein
MELQGRWEQKLAMVMERVMPGLPKVKSRWGRYGMSMVTQAMRPRSRDQRQRKGSMSRVAKGPTKEIWWN